MGFLQKISTTRIVLIVAAFLTLTGNTKFFSETLVVYPWSENAFFIISLSIWLFSFLAVLLLIVSYRYSVKPILITLLLVSSIVSYFANNYGIVIDDSMIINTLETNTTETMDLFTMKLAFYFLVLGILPSYWVYKAQITSSKLLQQIWSKLKAIIILIIVFVLVTLAFSKSYASLARENKHLRLYINPSYYLYSVGKYINSQFQVSSIPFNIIGQDAKVVHEQAEEVDREIVILVVGETARADRFSLNGYHRKTNPLLEKEDVVSFTNFYACGTSTAVSVPCMFSYYNKENYDRDLINNSSNILDTLHNTGVISVLWRDNNTGSKGVADRINFQDFSAYGVNTICDTECRDEGMLVGLQEYIDKSKNKDILIVLHMMGSHGPAYYKRYPKDFEKYKPVCETSQLNECSKEEINNAYDNTILYTDYFLSKVVKFLKKNANKGSEAIMIYMSDHGESLGEHGLYLHGAPDFIAPDEQIHVPFILWASGGDVKQDISYNDIKKKTNVRFSHQQLFHILLDFFEVETKLFNYDSSLRSGRYSSE